VHPFLCPLSLGAPHIISVQVPLCCMEHLIIRDFCKWNWVVCPRREGSLLASGWPVPAIVFPPCLVFIILPPPQLSDAYLQLLALPTTYHSPKQCTSQSLMITYAVQLCEQLDCF
jgi:hypothetical protein